VVCVDNIFSQYQLAHFADVKRLSSQNGLNPKTVNLCEQVDFFGVVTGAFRVLIGVRYDSFGISSSPA